MDVNIVGFIILYNIRHTTKISEKNKNNNEIILQILFVFSIENFLRSLIFIKSIPSSPLTGKRLNKKSPKLAAEKSIAISLFVL